MSNCHYCNKELSKGLKMHEKYCKSNPVNKEVIPKEIVINHPEQPKKTSTPKIGLVGMIRKIKHGIRVFFIGDVPINPKPDPNFKPIEGTQDARIKQFLADMPKWSYDASTWLQRTLLHAKSGMVYKTVVFVGEGNDCTRAYLPYDERKQRLVIDKAGYYQVECKGDVIFLDKEKLLPLKDAPDLSRFQNSANYVWSVYNGGYQEGLSQRFDELMDEINKERMLKYICMIVAILSIIALVGVSYFDGKSIAALAAQNADQFAQIANVTRRLANYE